MTAERRAPSLQSIRDHDLLIRLDQKVDVLSTDIKDLKDNLASRVGILEAGKTSTNITDDHEKRLRKLEEDTIPSLKYRIAYWSGAVAVILTIVSLVVAYINHH
jgi:hypothetical protein